MGGIGRLCSKVQNDSLLIAPFTPMIRFIDIDIDLTGYVIYAIDPQVALHEAYICPKVPKGIVRDPYREIPSSHHPPTIHSNLQPQSLQNQSTPSETPPPPPPSSSS